MRLLVMLCVAAASIGAAAFSALKNIDSPTFPSQIVVTDLPVSREEPIALPPMPSSTPAGLIGWALEFLQTVEPGECGRVAEMLAERSSHHLWTDLLSMHHTGLTTPDGRRVRLVVSDRLTGWDEAWREVGTGAIVMGEAFPPLDEGLTVAHPREIPLAESSTCIIIHGIDRSVSPVDHSTCIRMLIPAWSRGQNSHLQRMSISRTAFDRMFADDGAVLLSVRVRGND